MFFSSEQYYHIYNRGNQRERIFFERENYLFFLRRIRHYFNEVVEIVYYCLITRYIHLNPVFSKLVSNPEEWEFSSYREYVRQRNGILVRPDFILKQFKDHFEYQEFVESYQTEEFNLIRDFVIEENY